MSAALTEAEMVADLGWMGNAELHALLESIEYAMAATPEDDPHEVEFRRYMRERDLRLVKAELRRRETLHAIDNGLADPHAAGYLAWRDLARDVRERADIVLVFEYAAGYLKRVGKEWAGPCPICGGEDRFRVWSAADGKRPGYWCRQCGVSGDVISAYRNFLVPGSSFFDAVSVLAAMLGLRTPVSGMGRPRSPTDWRSGGGGGTVPNHDSPQTTPVRSKRGGNQPRPPAIRFAHGRAVTDTHGGAAPEGGEQ